MKKQTENNDNTQRKVKVRIMEMTMKKFASEMKTVVENKLLEMESGTDYEVSIQEVNKNNDIQLTGLNVRKGNSNTSVNYYLDEMLKVYNGKEEDEKETMLDEFSMEIVTFFRKNKPADFDISSFTDFEKVKDNIYYCLVNKDNNIYYQENCITVPYLDMLLIFKVFVQLPCNNDGIEGSITIKKEYLKNWEGITEKDLLNYAAINTPNLFPSSFRSMKDALIESIRRSFDLSSEEKAMQIAMINKSDDFPFYILTNKAGINGATAIMYKDLLKGIANELGADRLIIVPSSIHEVIIGEFNEYNLMIKDIVPEINGSVLATEEILSNNVYVYDAETDYVEIFS